METDRYEKMRYPIISGPEVTVLWSHESPLPIVLVVFRPADRA